MPRFMDRLTGNYLSPAVVEVIGEFAQSAKAMLQLLELGSIITPSERALVLSLIKSYLDSPAPVDFPPEFVDQMHALEQRLTADDAHAEEYAQSVQRAQEIANAMNAGQEVSGD